MVGEGRTVQIDHCPRCSGVWLEHGEVQQLRSVKRHSLLKDVARDSHPPQMR